MIKKFLLANDGWTFIETIIGITIVLLLSTGVGVAATKQLSRANVTAAKSQIGNFKLALEMYRLDNSRYPTSEQGLKALVEKPLLSPIPNNWNGPYLDKELPLDPWHNQYIYQEPGERSQPYTITSLGADISLGGDGFNKDIHSYD